MKSQFQILVSGPSGSQQGGASRPRIASRLKLVLGGLLFAAIAIGVLVIALVLGFLIAFVLWVVLAIAIVGVILKVTFRQDAQRFPRVTINRRKP